MKKVAIQGTLGSYHDIAAHKYFEGEEIQLICCANFEDVFAAVKKDSQTIGMLAIENTIAGSLLHNNELLRQSGAQIVGEYKLRISHSFVCLPEEDWDDITEVNSHPIALMQCREFLGQHPHIKVVEGEDTASVRDHQKREPERACRHLLQSRRRTLWHESVAGRHRNKQAQLHPLSGCGRSLASGRAEPPPQQRGQQGKHVFTLPHTEGSLSQVLSILSFYRINLTKIQSLPIIGREWEYQFYVDVVFDNVLKYKQSIVAITPLTKELKILGEYEDGKSNI